MSRGAGPDAAPVPHGPPGGKVRLRRLRNDEGGFVIAWFALLLLVLLGFAGFAVDVGHWWYTAQKTQRAADAAALAGAVFLPTSPTDAFTTAETTSSDNGYADGPDANVVPTQEPNPRRLRVSVSSEVNNFFGGLFGVNTTTITRDAVAEYQGPVPLGSPANTFGNEPVVVCVPADFAGNAAALAACQANEEEEWSTSDVSAQFWANLAGPQSNKSNGDAYQANLCGVAADFCVGSNQQYSQNGYYYTLRVEAAAGPVAIEVFDPAFIHVGDRCTEATLAGASGLTNPADARYRYAAGPASPFCTGDQFFGQGAGGLPVTTYRFFAPDNTPWDITDNPELTGACAPKQYSGFNGALLNRLNPAHAEYDDDLGDGHTVAETFRQWVGVCTLAVPTPGDYIIQTRTNAPLGSPTGYTTASGSGHNRLAIRAARTTGGGSGDGTGLSFFAHEKMGIYSNANGSDTRFHLAQVTPGADGRTLRINVFDTGDAGGAGTLQVLAPPDSNVPSAEFVNCRYRAATTSTFVSDPDCTVPINGTQNGRWHDILVPIPAGYDCDDSDSFGCWVRIKFTYPVGTTVQDTTSWSAQIIGDPVHLVE